MKRLLVPATCALVVSTAALASPARASSSSDQRPSAFDLELGIAGLNRDFSYRDAASDVDPGAGYPPLVPYQLAVGLAIGGQAHFYPGALFTSGFLGHLAIAFGYERGLGTRVRFAEGTNFQSDYDTAYASWTLGLRGRLPLGRHEGGMTVAYASQAYDVVGDEDAPILPDVHYQSIRVVPDGELRFGDWRLGAAVGPRFLFETGALATRWFPNAKGLAIEARVFLGLEVANGFEVRVTAHLVQTGLDFNPIDATADPWTTPVAGGATDRFLSGMLSLRYRIPDAP